MRNNRRYYFGLSVAICFLAALTASAQAPEKLEKKERLTAIHSTLLLKVINPDKARAALKQTAEKIGGHATEILDTRIILKIPPAKLSEALETFLAEGILVKKTIEREDLTLKITQLTGKLNSQIEILKKLRSFFDDSDFSATLQIERSMHNLVQEIEFVKGQLRYLHDQTQWSVVEIDFRFKKRDNVIYVSSPFQWLNTANLATFLENF